MRAGQTPGKGRKRGFAARLRRQGFKGRQRRHRRQSRGQIRRGKTLQTAGVALRIGHAAFVIGLRRAGAHAEPGQRRQLAHVADRVGRGKNLGADEQQRQQAAQAGRSAATHAHQAAAPHRQAKARSTTSRSRLRTMKTRRVPWSASGQAGSEASG